MSAPRHPLRARTRFITRTALIASMYAALTIALEAISFAPMQVRVSEALACLPFFSAPAVPGLFLGCLIANVAGGLGWYDIAFGSLATLSAAALTRWLGTVRAHPLVALAPPVLVNALVVPTYLHLLFNLPYWLTAGQVFVGQVIACYGLGYPLLLLLRRARLDEQLR